MVRTRSGRTTTTNNSEMGSVRQRAKTDDVKKDDVKNGESFEKLNVSKESSTDDVVRVAESKEANAIPNDTGKKKSLEKSTNASTESSSGKKPTPKSTNASTESSSGKKPSPLVIFIVLCIIISFISLTIICIDSGKVEAGMPEGLSLSPRNLLKNNITALKANFPSQQKHLWDTVSAAVDYHIRSEEPDGPIILLFGSRPDASETLRCLVEQLGRIISKTLGRVHVLVGPLDAPYQINGLELKNENADKAKKEVDNRLRKAFKSAYKVATVLNLDALPPCSVLLFHGFCDTDNAIFKNVAFIFTVTLDGVLSRQDEVASNTMDLKTESEFLVIDHLKRVLVDKCSDLPEEKFEALMSRIANNVGIVRPEEPLSCSNS